ncbi:putative exported protein [Rhodovulum sp. P5]|uniref:DUF1513 domain-containing protein n=1 Tax=Rhodovulum sp. P5 TaxID=1564506 RepID=UPI0009C1C626|nr:DUF1513 domain-containing protein [Rhodovulum sp. P5]ARE40728.1 putative exported protein [Rhodovulum sp. P5]
MAIETRREVLRTLALGLGVVACRGALGQPAERAVYVGIETAADSALSKASFFAGSGARLGHVPLDFRAHGLAEHGARLVVFPRRPGDRFSVVDGETLEIVQLVRAPADRHFFGHGAFTQDGAHLLVTENDLESLRGSIGVYDNTGPLRRVGQIALPGPGPHEIVRQPGRDVFHIALGGLETHPAYGRAPLNLHDFRSQVVTLDFETGDLTQLGYWPGSEGISLRHLAMDHRGRLYIGGQIKSTARATGDGVVWLVDGDCVDRLAPDVSLGGYVSSVAAHGKQALVSSKESGVVLCLDGQTVVGSQRMEGAGAAALGPGLTAVSGFTLLTLNGNDVAVLRGHEFDNHGLGIG